MATPQEPDFPPGHPARFDFNPDSPEAKEWARIHVHPRGERDFPVGHPKASDTPGNTNHHEWKPGTDPFHPEREQFTGRDPETAARTREVLAEITAAAMPSQPKEPTTAPLPPPPGDISAPAGQPGR